MRSVEHPDHLKALIEDAVFGVVEADASGRMLYVNPAWCSMLGYACEELLGKTVFDITHPESVGDTQNLIRALQAGQRSGTLAKRYLRKDGSVLQARSNLSARFDASGNLESIAAFVVDDSSEASAIQKAEAAEERLKEALAIGRMIAWQWDLQSQVLTSSSDPSQFWGTPIRRPEDFLAVVHPDDRERVALAMQEDAREVPSEIIYRTISADGPVRHVHSRRRVDVGPDGKPLRVRGIAADVTSTARAALTTQLLANAAETLGASLDYEVTLASLARVIVPNLADWYAVDLVDARGELERVAVYHADAAKIEIGRKLHDRYPPRREAPAGTWHTILTGQPSWLAELTDEMFRLGAESDEHYELLRDLSLCSFACLPLIARGRTIGVLTLAYAESRRHYSQDDVGLAMQIAQRVAVAVDNAQLFRALQEADRRKTEFLAMLAHELRNPLAPVRMAADVLQATAPESDPVRRATDIIRRQVSHMTELVDDLLDVSRVTRGLVELQRQPVDLKSAAAGALEQAQPLIEARRHTLHTRISPDALTVMGDRARLIQVIVNLLTNAAKYTPAGGEIELSVDTEGSSVRIRVCDNGAGIEPGLLPHLFELFTQGDRTPDRSQGGLGIGLALVRSIVELHGGEVRVRSPGAGLGSTFTVLLPRLVDAEVTVEVSEPRRLTGAAPLRVLVVDDNQDAAAMAAAVLSVSGHVVALASSGQEALEVASARGPFDAYVLDIGLPDMTGYELAQHLKAASASARLVALTGYGQQQDREAAVRAGFDVHLVKPADVQALLESVEPH